MKKFVIGIDLGGTKIIGTILDENNNKLSVVKKESQVQKGISYVIDKIILIIQELLDNTGKKSTDLIAIGIGVPGIVDSSTEQIIFAPNLKWENVALKKILMNKFSCPIYIENDGNAGVYAEYIFDKELIYKNIVGIFIGTGIGGGIILNGQIYRGANGFAGEIGHMIIKKGGPICSCGNKGCLEVISSKSGMMKKILKDKEAENLGFLAEFLKDKDYVLKSSHLKKLIKEKNQYIIKLIDQAIKGLAIAILNLANILNPELVILGGGLIETFPNYILKRVKKKINKFNFQTNLQNLKLRTSFLGDSAVMIGVAILAKKIEYNKNIRYNF